MIWVMSLIVVVEAIVLYHLGWRVGFKQGSRND